MIINGPASSLPFPPFRQRFPWIGADLQTLRNTIRGTGVDLSGYTTERIRFPCMDGSRDVLLAALNRPTSPMEKPLVLLIHGRRQRGQHAHHHGRALLPFVWVCRFAVEPARGRPIARDLQRLLPCRSQRRFGRGYFAALRRPDPPRRLPHGYIAGRQCAAQMFGRTPSVCPRESCRCSITPIDLKAAQLRIMEPRNGKYQSYLLKRMKEGIQSSDLMDDICIESLAKIDTVYAFDDQIVAPANGFADAPDYYRSSSALTC